MPSHTSLCDATWGGGAYCLRGNAREGGEGNVDVRILHLISETRGEARQGGCVRVLTLDLLCALMFCLYMIFVSCVSLFARLYY